MKKVALIFAILMMSACVYSQNAPAGNKPSHANTKSDETKTRYVDKNQNHFRQVQNKNSKSAAREKPVVKKTTDEKIKTKESFK